MKKTAKIELKVGDVVLLRSGSPQMTIEQVGTTESACVWFENNILYRNKIPNGCLIVKEK